MLKGSYALQLSIENRYRYKGGRATVGYVLLSTEISLFACLHHIYLDCSKPGPAEQKYICKQT